MAGPALPVEEKPTARLQQTPTVSGSATARVVINGGGSAGSKHIVAASAATDVLAEQIRLSFPAGTYSVTLMLLNGVAAHQMVGRVIFDPGTDVAAAVALRDGFPNVRFFPNDTPRVFDTTSMAQAAFDIYVVVTPVAGATLSSCSGELLVEGN